MMNLRIKPLFVLAAAAATLSQLPSARSDDTEKMLAGKKVASASTVTGDNTAPDTGEQVNVDNIKKKYWARGNESELGVVQNRTYTKERKLEVGLLGGIVSTDPFLTVDTLGFDIGYHFNEYWSWHLLGFKDYVSSSSALTTLQAGQKQANTNPPYWFVGSEGEASLLYGKLSIFGTAIIYYDMHALLGTGLTSTESGNYFTPMAGIGQSVFITQHISLRLDYRLMVYKENIVEKEITNQLGQVVGTRTNLSNAVVLGITFMTDSFKK